MEWKDLASDNPNNNNDDPLKYPVHIISKGGQSITTKLKLRSLNHVETHFLPKITEPTPSAKTFKEISIPAFKTFTTADESDTPRNLLSNFPTSLSSMHTPD